MDRLYGTLNDRIETWHSEMNMLKGCCGIDKKNPAFRDLLKIRLLVAYDLSAAFQYLHDCRYVFFVVICRQSINGTILNFIHGLC